MAKILDLSVYNNETLDITMLDGSVLHIKKPTQALVIRMVELSQLQENQPEKVLDGLVELCAAILSNNNDGITYSVEQVANELDIVLVSAIIKAYSEFTKELQSNPI